MNKEEVERSLRAGLEAIERCEQALRPFRERVNYLEKRLALAERLITGDASAEDSIAWQKLRAESENRIS